MDLLAIWHVVLPLGRDGPDTVSRSWFARASVFLSRAAWFVIDLPVLVRFYTQARRGLRRFARPMLAEVFDERALRPGDASDVLARAQRDFTRLHMVAAIYRLTPGDVEALWRRVHCAFAEGEAAGELRRAATRRYLRWSDIYVWKTVASWCPVGRAGGFWRAFDALMRFTFTELGDSPASREALARHRYLCQKDDSRSG